MKKIIVAILVLFFGTKVSSQNDYRGRVGINTLEPKATLDISRKDPSSLPAGQSQGVLFPQFTTDERDAFENVEAGTMIYNTTEQCLEICVSSPDGSCEWQCIELRRSLPKVTFDDVTVRILSVSANQGKIDDGSNKINVRIPYSGGLGGYKAISIESMAVEGQDNQTKKLVLKIPEGNFDASGSGFLEGEIEVVDGGEYLVKHLSMGGKELIAEFLLQTKSGISKVSLKGIGGIADRCYNKTTRDCWSDPNLADELEHQFVYLPITAPDGKIWLSQNLGAEYSNINSVDFDPSKQDFSVDDKKAYGSMFQWQRPSDGHELIDWTSSTEGTSKYGAINELSTNAWIAHHNRFIINDDFSETIGLLHTWVNSGFPTYFNSRMTYWQRTLGYHNPCPEGFHVPTEGELEALHRALRSNRKQVWDHSAFRLPAAGYRDFFDASLYNQGSLGVYWSSSGRSTQSTFLRFDSSSSSIVYDEDSQASGFSVRCIQD